MLLKTYLRNGGSLFSNNMVDNVVTLYGEEATPTWLDDDMLDVYQRYIKTNNSKREIYSDTEDMEDITEEVQERTELLFISNYLKYQHLHDLFIAEYNPIWNVDGTETTTRNLTDNKTTSAGGTDTTTHNTTDARTTSNTETLNTSDARTTSNTETLNTSDARTTSNTETLNTSDARTTSNTETLNNTDTTTYNTTDSKTSTTAKTTFDSSAFLDTERVTESASKTGTEATAHAGTVGNAGSDTLLKTGTVGNAGSDTLLKTGTVGNAGTDTLLRTGTDTTQHTSNGTDATAVHETISFTRGGNIGVTSTQDLATQEMNYANKINFVKIVCNDIVREICYMC